MTEVKKNSYLLFVVTVIIFFKCGAPFFSGSPAPIVSSDKLLKKVHKNAVRLTSFRGEARIRMISEQGGFRGNIKISMKKPDSLWMKIEGPLGMDIACGCISDGRMKFYIPPQKIVYTGSVDRLRDTGIIPLDVEFNNIIHSFLGLIDPPYSSIDSTAVYSLKEDAYLLSLGDNERIWIKSSRPVVCRWEKYDVNGELLWEWEGDMFYMRKNIRMPKFIQITQYKPKQRITFYYNIMKANYKMPKNWCVLSIPEGVETIEL